MLVKGTLINEQNFPDILSLSHTKCILENI